MPSGRMGIDIDIVKGLLGKTKKKKNKIKVNGYTNSPRLEAAV